MLRVCKAASDISHEHIVYATNISSAMDSIIHNF